MFSNFDHVVQPTDIKERLLLSVVSYATLLEAQFDEWLLPAPTGIYMPGNFSPSLVPDKPYFVNVNGKWLQITNIDEVDLPVHDANFKLVLNAYVMQNKSRLLSPKPTIPVRGIRLFQKLIDFEITSILRWCRHAQGCENRIRQEFLPEYRYSIDIGIIRECGRYVTHQVHEFIGNDDWNYYRTSIVGPDIVVEKGPDYRVCEWYRMMQENAHSQGNEY